MCARLTSLANCVQLAKGDAMTVSIGVAVRLTLDEGYDPPQGSVFIISDSKIFEGEGFWSVVEDTDDGVPTAIQVCCTSWYPFECRREILRMMRLTHVCRHLGAHVECINTPLEEKAASNEMDGEGKRVPNIEF